MREKIRKMMFSGNEGDILIATELLKDWTYEDIRDLLKMREFEDKSPELEKDYLYSNIEAPIPPQLIDRYQVFEKFNIYYDNYYIIISKDLDDSELNYWKKL